MLIHIDIYIYIYIYMCVCVCIHLNICIERARESERESDFIFILKKAKDLICLCFCRFPFCAQPLFPGVITPYSLVCIINPVKEMKPRYQYDTPDWHVLSLTVVPFGCDDGGNKTITIEHVYISAH